MGNKEIFGAFLEIRIVFRFLRFDEENFALNCSKCFKNGAKC
jgi:hypothetical protein